MSSGAWILVAALVLALAVGLWRAATDGRFRGTHVVRGAAPAPAPEGGPDAGPDAVEPADEPVAAPPGAEVVAEVGATLGERATLLQFSSAFCAPCRATRRVLADVAEIVPGVVHVEVDAEHHLEAVRRLGVLRTPTTLVLGPDGAEVTRAAGAPRKEQVLSALAAVDPV
ncbi:thioredoxin family protein [Nocardioides sediminis]|uniref:thioredoxin family protein n=1 Tax=Nocardioides sediminis TaxID=433648 RepID=UPI000D318881|nr:thioredoxin family protein [Nocardioides sediminis]